MLIVVAALLLSPAASTGGQWSFEVDVHPSGTAPAGAVVTGSTFTATAVGESAPDGSCTTTAGSTPADTTPGAQACTIPGLLTNTTYVIHQTATATGFAPAADQTQATPAFDPGGPVNAAVLTFADAGTWRPLTLAKTGSDGGFLSGATYDLCAQTTAANPAPLPVSQTCPGGEVGLRTTDVQGHATWDAVLPGAYSLVETAPPAGWAANPEQPVVVDPSSTGEALVVSAVDARAAGAAASASPTTKHPRTVSPTTPALVLASADPSTVTGVTAPTSLAYTGSSALSVLVGAGLIAAGAGTLVSSRRRRA